VSLETHPSQLYAGGVELSGGETQKIAISRIFSSDCPFFVLDEPTSSLDPYAEYNLYKVTSKNPPPLVANNKI
jgi:ABC-type transport system involved in cytochrome bd biosynthesis fused ATPase/permease subunit